MIFRFLRLFHQLRLSRLFRKGLDSLVGSAVKSPLEQDFGEASEWDIQIPDATLEVDLPLDEIYTPLLNMFNAIDGLSPENVQKIGLRMTELPVGKVADFRYQVRDNGAPIELQISMTKEPGNQVGLYFCSSEGIIESVKASFQ